MARGHKAMRKFLRKIGLGLKHRGGMVHLYVRPKFKDKKFIKGAPIGVFRTLRSAFQQERES